MNPSWSGNIFMMLFANSLVWKKADFPVLIILFWSCLPNPNFWLWSHGQNGEKLKNGIMMSLTTTICFWKLLLWLIVWYWENYFWLLSFIVWQVSLSVETFSELSLTKHCNTISLTTICIQLICNQLFWFIFRLLIMLNNDMTILGNFILFSRFWLIFQCIFQTGKRTPKTFWYQLSSVFHLLEPKDHHSQKMTLGFLSKVFFTI